jgi:aspartyl-tRNA(Asn)/glutamyl-tRNA(Gln) amidotransferase subunit A
MAADSRIPGPSSTTPAHPAPTIAEAARALRAGETSAESLLDACLARISSRDAVVNAFISVTADQARVDARQADRERADGHDRGTLHGIPISIKDILDVRGAATTAASRVRAAMPASQDAPVIARLRRAGAVIVGKTNLHEFALGTTNEESAFGPVHHPLDPDRSPGGSSGGSAASVLAEMALASIGTDTGGSVRIPAAACGLVGLKPTIGEIPLEGVVLLSQTLDHVGPLCRSVEDAVILYEACLETQHVHAEPDPDVRTMRFGVLRGYFTSRLEPPVASAFELACARLADAGAALGEVTIPHAADIAPIYLHIVLAEAAAIHARTLERQPDDYTPNVRLRLEMGRAILAEDYLRALRGRDVLTREVDEALAGHTALLLPTLPIAAPRLGAATVTLGGVEEPIRSVMLRLTQLFNITGHPAITLPCTAAPAQLPVGLQLAGARHRTGELLAVARVVERQLRPGLSGAGSRGRGTA